MIIVKAYKFTRYVCMSISEKISWVITYIKFVLNGVEFSNDFVSYGIPIINVNLRGKLVIGNRNSLHNGKYYNMIGRQQPNYFIVGEHAQLSIGNNVGISCSALICNCKISIEDNVKIGGNVVIYDSDFHSLTASERNATHENKDFIKMAPIVIMNNAFIGAHSTILKGVTIGENSIIGACSVVVKNVPANEIWAGNPARFVKSI